MMPLPDLSDQDSSGLFARARAGDQAAWEELFRTCYPKVIRVVRRKLDRPLRNLYDSTDFASDVMKSLAANLDRLDFPSIGSLMAFLAQVAEQKVIDEHRRRRTLKRDMTRERPIAGGDGAEAAAPPIASADPTASQLAQESELRDRFMARPSESERAVVELKLQGYSTAEIAEQTGWNIRKVQRFLKDLEHSLPDQGDEP
jgi:RNA polymerase sigma factor (sigma-70 family)